MHCGTTLQMSHHHRGMSLQEHEQLCAQPKKKTKLIDSYPCAQFEPRSLEVLCLWALKQSVCEENEISDQVSLYWADKLEGKWLLKMTELKQCFYCKQLYWAAQLGLETTWYESDEHTLYYEAYCGHCIATPLIRQTRVRYLIDTLANYV
jgi:hypothetical protein